ncbi:hypothetical protein [Bacillus sp. BML-BC060]|uniref:hypothetical protein n=1 Tax=Bacillus sp. BML-BC060 TaxID=2842487 RepID=UPI001C7EF5F2|nr:hypothetical protein [Bacillus sp. BML-BC060]
MDIIVGKYPVKEVARMIRKQAIADLLRLDEKIFEGFRAEVKFKTYKNTIHFQVNLFKKDCKRLWEKTEYIHRRSKNLDKRFIYSYLDTSTDEIREIIFLDYDELEVENDHDCILKKLENNQKEDLNSETRTEIAMCKVKTHQLIVEKKYDELILVFEKMKKECDGALLKECEEAIKIVKKMRLANLLN